MTIALKHLVDRLLHRHTPDDEAVEVSKALDAQREKLTETVNKLTRTVEQTGRRLAGNTAFDDMASILDREADGKA